MAVRNLPANKTTSTALAPSVESYSSSVNATGSAASWASDQQSKLLDKWAANYENYNGSFSNPYFDYFFTGQDICVLIDGLTDWDDMLPIYSMGYQVQQQKTPLYGFWSYTLDAMLRGTRIVSGAFSIVSMSPTFLAEKIAKAARVRAIAADAGTFAAQGISSIHGLEDDQRKIDRYWKKHFDPDATGQQQLFSIHPPFNFTIKYGWQQGSVITNDPNVSSQNVRDHFYSQDAISQDFNERLVQSLPSGQSDMTIVLDNVELTSKSVEYNVDGDPLLETYTFLARDEHMLKPLGADQLQPAVSDDRINDPYAVGTPSVVASRTTGVI